jgi:hypothetical protein
MAWTMFAISDVRGFIVLIPPLIFVSKNARLLTSHKIIYVNLYAPSAMLIQLLKFVNLLYAHQAIISNMALIFACKIVSLNTNMKHQ